MDCGKSTLALQMDHNHRARGRGGVRFSRNDRAGGARISSRLGLETDCVEVLDATDFWDEVIQRRMDRAAAEISHWAEYDYVLINNDAEKCRELVHNILKAERLKAARRVFLHDFVREMIGGR